MESRYCQFEIDGGSTNLGQHNTNDTDTQTKVTHIELFGCRIIGTLASLSYGTWQGQPAALLVLYFSLRGRDSGPLRFKKAQVCITFRPRTSGERYPVVRSFQPTNNLTDANPILKPGAPSSRASSSLSPWPRETFAIRGSKLCERSQNDPNQVFWNLMITAGSEQGICESMIPLATILTFSGPFEAIVVAKAGTVSGLKLQTLPWSKDDPLFCDGITPKGKRVATTDLSSLGKVGLLEFMSDWLNSSSSREDLFTSTITVSTTPEERAESGRETLLQLEPSRPVYRVQGIPAACPSNAFAKVLGLAFSVPEDTIRIKAFSRSPQRGHEGNVAIMSFSSEPAELSLSSGTGWYFRLPSQLWLASQDGSASGESNRSMSIAKEGVDLFFDSDFLGFTDVGINSDPLVSTNVDIIAIHGLGGHAFGSFKQRKGPYMWLQESLGPDLLSSQEFGEAIRPRILVYGYKASVDNSQSFQGIVDLAIELRWLLRGIRQQDPNRPLIFIGHSLGGLLIKDLLILCAEPNADPVDSALLKATIGVLFFGVPNKGMDITATLSIIGNQPNKVFLSSLGVDSPILADQAKSFPECFDSRDATIYSFYETCVSNTAKRVEGKFTLTGDPVVLVDNESATHSRPWEMNNNFIIPIQRPHADLAKFEKYSPDYEKVRNCIEEILAKRFGRREE